MCIAICATIYLRELRSVGRDITYYMQVSRHFTEIKVIWLIFDSLIYFTTLDWKKLFKGGVRGLVIFRECISTLSIRSTLREPFDFILLFLRYKLTYFLFGRKGLRIVIKRRKRPSYLHFIDSEGPSPLPTYPWGIRTS